MFDPARHGFLKSDFSFPKTITLYELAVGGLDQSSHDKKRLNTYLTQDGDFVTIWFGLIDSSMLEISMGFADDPTFDFKSMYDEDLFRGYIEDGATGAIILKALRLERQTPNILTINDAGQLECHALCKP